MNTGIHAARLVGVAQLAVFLGGLVSEQLLKSAVGSGSTSEKLINISSNLARLRISNLVSLLTSVAIIVLGILFYVAFHKEHKALALAALALYLAEAITLAVSKIGAHALIPASQAFVEAGAPEASHYQALGDFLYTGVDRRGYDIHMLFFCLGGILWYYLLFATRAVPLALSIWGLASIGLLTVPTLMLLYDRNLTHALFLGLPYAPYELVLGVWLVVKGFS